MLKWLLEGKWLGIPLHPLLVHLPIGLYVMSLLLDLASLVVSDGNPFVRGAFYTMVVGTICALIAVFPGLMDWLDIRDDHPAKQIGIYHMVLNLMLIAVYGINIAVRWDLLHEGRTRGLWLGMSLLAIGILSISGYLGGMMVYDEGIGVGRHRRRGKTPRETIVTDPKRAEDNFMPVANLSQFSEDQSLRVDVNGVIMSIAKVGGEFFAFQEFCTHRFGPLSEGCFRNGEVMCPWHRSRFDLRSGKVTNGPAKEDIRTFRVLLRDDIVYVEVPERPSR